MYVVAEWSFYRSELFSSLEKNMNSLSRFVCFPAPHVFIRLWVLQLLPAFVFLILWRVKTSTLTRIPSSVPDRRWADMEADALPHRRPSQTSRRLSTASSSWLRTLSALLPSPCCPPSSSSFPPLHSAACRPPSSFASSLTRLFP